MNRTKVINHGFQDNGYITWKLAFMIGKEF